jgi:hypothetical protein
VGAQLLDLLLAAAAGTPAFAYCSGGGSHAFVPAVPATLAAGSSFSLTFEPCVAAGGGGTIRTHGSVALTLGAVSGSPGSADYGVTMTATSIALTVDEPGTTPLLAQAFSGGL